MRTYGIISGKGGVGKTTIAINLSYAFAELGKRVCLVDMNLTTPHVATMLSFSFDRHLIDYLKGRANELESVYPYQKFWIMPSPLRLESLEDITSENFLSLKRDLGHFDHLILDAAPGFGKEAVFSFFLSDNLILVINPTYSSLIDAMKAKQLAEKLGKNIEGVIINKFDRGSLTVYDVEKTLEIPVLGTIKYNKKFLEAERLRIPASYLDKKIRNQFIEIARKILKVEKPKEESIYKKIMRFFSWRR